MPTLTRPALREVRRWAFDSRRWNHYRPRADDIIIDTNPKCGTTWMQRIVGMLLAGSPAPQPIQLISAWIDARFRQPIEAVIEQTEAQTSRRSLKSHLPLDAMPQYDGVRIIHVARDGRDACMSFHNHMLAMTPATLASFDRIGLQDPTIGRTVPRPAADPRAFFLDWIGSATPPFRGPAPDFFALEQSYWTERTRPGLLLVHYNDLLVDLAGEIRRIAKFLGIDCAPALLARLVEAAGFAAMRCSRTRPRPFRAVPTASCSRAPTAAGATCCTPRTSRAMKAGGAPACRPTVYVGWQQDDWGWAIPPP